MTQSEQSVIQSGDRVSHQHAGTGRVLWVKGGTAQVSWDKGGQGIAYVRDLTTIGWRS